MRMDKVEALVRKVGSAALRAGQLGADSQFTEEPLSDALYKFEDDLNKVTQRFWDRLIKMGLA